MVITYLHFNCMFQASFDEGVILLIVLQPVHFLANSVIGPSFYVEMPTNVTYSYNQTFSLTPYQSYYYGPAYNSDSYDSACVSQNSFWTFLALQNRILGFQQTGL